MTEIDIVQRARALLKMPRRDRFAMSNDGSIAILLDSDTLFGAMVYCSIHKNGKKASDTKHFLRYKSALNYFNELVKKYKLEESVI